jgi:hypothetical protein
MRWVLAIISTALIILTYYGISIPATVLGIMATQNPSSSSDIPIKVTISPASQSSSSTEPSSLFLNVTLENTSPSQPLSLLRWSSPLDPHADAIGVFSFSSKSTGNHAPCINLKINRKIPGSGVFSQGDENIVTIEAGGKIEREAEVRDHEVELEKGETYAVKAKGRWMGVWVGEQRVLGMGEGSGLRTGEFESESVEVSVPS